MARLSMRRVRPLALLLAGALLGASVSIVSGAIPSSAGQINACYSKTSGALRAFDYPTAHCKSTEKFLRWDVKGIPGPQGAAGTAGGPAGAPGPAGPAGVSGYEAVTHLGSYGVVTANIDRIDDAITCPAGKVAIGGGGEAGEASASAPNGSFASDLAASHQDLTNPARWDVTFGPHSGNFFQTGFSVVYRVYAVCAKAN